MSKLDNCIDARAFGNWGLRQRIAEEREYAPMDAELRALSLQNDAPVWIPDF
jgi:hypothetical protein